MAFTPATFRRLPRSPSPVPPSLGLPAQSPPRSAPAPFRTPRSRSTKADRAGSAQAACERANRARASLVRVALNQKGERYVSGASGPQPFRLLRVHHVRLQTATGGICRTSPALRCARPARVASTPAR